MSFHFFVFYIIRLAVIYQTAEWRQRLTNKTTCRIIICLRYFNSGLIMELYLYNFNTMIIVVPYMAIIVWIDRRRSAEIIKQTYMYVVACDSTCTTQMI